MMEIGRPYSRLVRRLESFVVLSSQDRQAIAELPLTVRNFTNQDVASQGDTPTQSALILDGFLYRHKLVNGTRRQIISFHVAGDVPDLHTLHLAKMDHNLSALGSAVVAFIPHSAFRKILENSSQLTHAFWRESLVDAAIFCEWVINLGQRDALGRVAHLLCELTLRLQVVGLARNHSFKIPWTQSDVADACGISTVHANRMVQELRRLDLIGWDSRTIRILDWETLMKVADFSPDYLHLRKDYPEKLELEDYQL